jgi:hypothetical protein
MVWIDVEAHEMLLRELQITKHRNLKLNVQKHCEIGERERERWVVHMREEAWQTTVREAYRATVAPFLAYPRTVALRLTLYLSLSRFSPFTFMLTRAHLLAFHSHFLIAHKTGTEFLKFLL